MERVNGGSLNSALHKHVMTDEQKFDCVCGFANGLEFLHSQVPAIVHKDLKPDNLMVQHMGNGKYNVKIIDFGESFTTSAPDKTNAQKLCFKSVSDSVLDFSGKAGSSTHGYYHNTDQLYGRITDKWDIFSFGVIVNEIYASSGGEDYEERCRNAGKPLANDQDYVQEVGSTLNAWFKEVYNMPFCKQWIEDMFQSNENVTLQLGTIAKNVEGTGKETRSTLQNYFKNGDVRPEKNVEKIPVNYRTEMSELIEQCWKTAREERPTARDIIERQSTIWCIALTMTA